LCPPGAWPEETLRWRSWRAAVRRADIQYDIYGEVTARWNARVAYAGAGRTFDLLEYFSYVLNVYEQCDAIDRSIDDAGLAGIADSWRRPPDAHEPSPPWLDYVDRVRGLIDSFYPDVPAMREAAPPAEVAPR
jgi:hypothetical protein